MVHGRAVGRDSGRSALRRASRLWPAVAVLLSLGFPAAALAAPVTIGFDDLAAGTVIADQYLQAGLPGRKVRFGIKPDGSKALPIYAAALSDAASAPNVAYGSRGNGEFCEGLDN